MDVSKCQQLPLTLAVLVAASVLFSPTALAQCDATACTAPTCSACCDTLVSDPPCHVESLCPAIAKYASFSKTLADRGIVLQNNVTQFYMGNTVGGVEREFRYSGHGDYVMNADFGKLGVQEGLFLKIRAEHRFGGSEAIDLFFQASGKIDILVTDLMMPKMNGRELADILREKVPHLSVLYISGYSGDLSIQTDAENGVDAFLQKPFLPIDLASKVRSVLDELRQE